jgi:quercetin dioxygenase-like cupin family protein
MDSLLIPDEVIVMKSWICAFNLRQLRGFPAAAEGFVKGDKVFGHGALAGRHCVIDMYIPAGGGPPPHRHNFEETFTILEGEIELVFRGEKLMARAGATVNIPANAPHSFKNAASRPARLLCMCSPAGLEEMFKRVGDPVHSRTAAPPGLSDAEKAERLLRAQAVASEFQTELLIP